MEYPGFANIAKRVATLIAAGTPPEIVWYGAGQAMNLALENQLADVGDVLKATGGAADNQRMVYKGADRSIPTSQQFTYGWYRKDLFQAKGLERAQELGRLPQGGQGAQRRAATCTAASCPSAETGASTLLLETMFMKNNVHWFEWNAGKKDYEVVLDKGDQKKRARRDARLPERAAQVLARGEHLQLGRADVHVLHREGGHRPGTWARGCSTRPSPTTPRSPTPPCRSSCRRS